MATGKDKSGRAQVVVTGLGVVTSLGAGKPDNWAKLTAGQSGIKAITRFRFYNDATGAKPAIDACLSHNPPQAVSGLVQNLGAEIDAALASPSTTG